jgi:hypothetical protein
MLLKLESITLPDGTTRVCPPVRDPFAIFKGLCLSGNRDRPQLPQLEYLHKTFALELTESILKTNSSTRYVLTLLNKHLPTRRLLLCPCPSHPQNALRLSLHLIPPPFSHRGLRHPPSLHDSHWSSRHELCPSISRLNMPRPRHEPVRSSFFLTTAEAVTVCKEEVERAETHEMDILGPHTSSVTGSLRSVSTGQDINDGAQSVISQVEGVTSIWHWCRILRRLACSVTGFKGDDISEINIDQSRSSRDDVSHTTLDWLDILHLCVLSVTT